MKGFTRIPFPGLLQEGDILLAPPEARALHVSAATLSRHGLSNGDTCRSDNSAHTVAEWFTGTRDCGLAMMVSSVTMVRKTESAHKVMNTLKVTEPDVKLAGFRAHRLDDRLIPTNTDTYCGKTRSYVMGTVAPLVMAVKAEFEALCNGKMLLAKYDTEPAYDDTVGWSAMRRALMAPFGEGATMFRHVPAVWQSDTCKPQSYDDIKRMTCRLFGANSPYEWTSTSRNNTLTVRDLRTIDHFFSNGMEIHRPEPETWKALAREVLARHAQLVMADFVAAEESLNKFTRQMKADVADLSSLEKDWALAAKELAGRTVVASPYQRTKEA